MRKIALLYNPQKPKACSVLETITALLHQADIQTVQMDAGANFQATAVAEKLESVELAFVLGGDGTLLGVARHLAPLGVPLLGINAGHLGFLTEAEPSHVEEAVRRVVERDYDLEPRLMLEASVLRDGAIVGQAIGLNDAGVAKGSFARMVTIDVHMDDIYLDTYSGDGVIVSTPTGSTAYSLSCGGPIVIPQLKVMLVTPICPHTLVSRPCVIDASQVVQLTVHAAHHDLCLTVDGQVGIKLEPEDVVQVAKSQHQTTLVKWRDREFFTVLRQKLHDTGSVHRPV